MGRLDGIDDAGRAIAGLLTYNPGPGIYSRLERAVEGMPANVRVEELPGLLRRYKEGVPGWELKAVDLDSTIAGRDVVPRDELLAAVRERSPVYTHKEIVLGGIPPKIVTERWNGLPKTTAVYAEGPSPLGQGTPHGGPVYDSYGQGGDEYQEILLLQPGARGGDFGTHWSGHPQVPGTNQAVAHARFDIHGDALRINELQSDLNNHNIKARQIRKTPDYRGGDGPFDFMPPQDDAAMAAAAKQATEIPFPLEDAWTELLIKRLALEAARKGHRAIEVASPRAIADAVHMPMEHAEYLYGKVVPGALERLGRKMGGLTEVALPMPQDPRLSYSAALEEMSGNQPLSHAFDAMRLLREASPRGPRPAFEVSTPGVAWNKLAAAYQGEGDVGEMAQLLHGALSLDLARAGDAAKADAMMPQLMRLAEDHAANMDRYSRVERLAAQQSQNTPIPRAAPPGRRYIMSDEMRRNLIEKGVGASLLAPLLMQGEE